MFEKFIAMLVFKGGKATNKWMIENLKLNGWSLEDYLNIKKALKKGGYISLGRGRGGTVILVNADLKFED